MSGLTLAALTSSAGIPILIGDFFGFILALPLSLFLVYWISDVKNKFAVVAGAFVGAFIGFIIILAWAGTLLKPEPLPGANGGSVFFGSLFFCSALGLVGGILTDLLVARSGRRNYRREAVTEHE